MAGKVRKEGDEMKSTVKLSMATARKIVKNIFPSVKLESETAAPEISRFKGTTGPDGMEVVVENDWLTGDGKIVVTVSDLEGMGHIKMLYDPKTLQRDAKAEERMAREEAQQQRIEWTHSVGVEMAHRLVDQYGREKL